jgi:hypothetical protein
MQDFIARGNIERYSKLLEHESDLVQRQLLEDLLAEEEAQLYGGDGARLMPSSTPSDRLRARHQG